VVPGPGACPKLPDEQFKRWRFLNHRAGRTVGHVYELLAPLIDDALGGRPPIQSLQVDDRGRGMLAIGEQRDRMWQGLRKTTYLLCGEQCPRGKGDEGRF